MKPFRVLLMCGLASISCMPVYPEGVRFAEFRGQTFFYDDMAFDNEIRTDPMGSDDSSTVFGVLTPLELGLIYQLQLAVLLVSSLNLIAPSDIVKDDTVDIELETFDQNFQKVSCTYLFADNVKIYDYDLNYAFGNPADPYPRFRIQADVVDPIQSASHAVLNYEGGFGFRQYFTNFQNSEDNKGATLFVGNVFLDDVNEPQHPSSMMTIDLDPGETRYFFRARKKD